MLYFYSDPHFGHTNIIRYCERPFANVAEMNAELIRRYNETVGPNDTVVWVGDCFFCSAEQARGIIDQLDGTKILVLGNHDRRESYMERLGFSLVVRELRMNLEGRSVRVSHYPWRHFYDPSFKYYERCPTSRSPDELLFHGHVHDAWTRKDTAINVGVDVRDFRPVTVAELLKR